MEFQVDSMLILKLNQTKKKRNATFFELVHDHDFCNLISCLFRSCIKFQLMSLH